MLETYDFLKKTEVNYISIINDNKLSCKPFGCPIICEEKIYILTSRDKMLLDK